MNYPKITIITPSYNSGNTLENTIKSIISQDYPNIEYIIIDGKSNDNTLDIIKKYSEYINYWISEKDNGQSHALLKGFKVASGDLIGWLNADEYLMPGTLSLVAKTHIKNMAAGVIYGDVEKIYQNITKTIKINKLDLSTIRYHHKIPIQPSVFFQKKILDEHGFVREKYSLAMDLDLYCRLIQVTEFLYLPVTLGAFTWGNNKSDECRKEQILEALAIHKENFKNDKCDLILIYFNTLKKFFRYYLRFLRPVKKIF